MKNMVRTVAAVVVFAVAARALAQQPEPYQALGAWKLNPGKSTGIGSQLSAKSRIHTIEDHGGGVTVNRIEQINADDSKQTLYYTARSDGTAYPMFSVRADGTVQVGTITSTRVDAYTVKWAMKNSDGKVTAEGTRTVSKDGSTYTLGTLVYDRLK